MRKANHPELSIAARATFSAERAKRGLTNENLWLPNPPCEICGSRDGSVWHHDDYSHPLEVRPLCRVHHGQWHGRIKSPKDMKNVPGRRYVMERVDGMMQVVVKPCTHPICADQGHCVGHTEWKNRVRPKQTAPSKLPEVKG